MSNTITYVTPQLLAQGLLALRQQSVLARLVNRSYDGMAAQPGNVINVPLPSSITARSVSPAVTAAANVDSSPTSVAVTLDRWYEAPFHLSDNDEKGVIAGFIPMQASEAIKALANDIDSFIFGKHIGFYGLAGTVATTPFSTNLTAAVSARALLNAQLAPLDDRRAVLDPSAEANLLHYSSILDFDKTGQQDAIIKGTIGRKLGVDWYMDQNVTTYTPGTSWVTGWYLHAACTAGRYSATIANATVTVMAQINAGDIFALNGQQYVVTTAKTTASITDGTEIVFYPAMKTTGTASALITAVNSAYTANLMFHRDALIFASRPLADIAGLGNVMQTATDPISGVALRLELSRQYKQTTFSYDYLGGCAVARREYAVKIAG